MKTVVIVCQGLAGYTIADQPQQALVGQYLHSFDPDANDGYGQAEWTTDEAGALVFPSIREAHAMYSQVSSVRPQRGYGPDPTAANRPLTAFTVEFRSVDDGEVEPPYGDD